MKKSYRFVVVPMLIVFAFCGGVALGSDADLQQYNGTASFAADWTAQAKLLVRDGKKITADDNGAGKAPVNRGLKQVIDIIGGIHDGIFGSAPGATRRTVKSLEADGTGGNVSTLLAGGIASNTANDRSLMTPTDVSVFKISPTGGQTQMTKGAIIFTNTTDGGGNPARTVSVINKVLPLNTVKAWLNAATDGAGGVTITDGFNITSCAVIDNITVDCQLAGTLADTNGLIQATTTFGHDIQCSLSAANTVHCQFFDRGAMTQNCLTLAAPNNCVLKLTVLGRQTS